jgi:hypothetical protein
VPSKGASRIVAAELQSPDPERLAARWSQVLGRPIDEDADVPTIGLDLGRLRFVPATDGRGEGLGGIDVAVSAADRALQAALDHGLAAEDGALLMGGVRVRLV